MSTVNITSSKSKRQDVLYYRQTKQKIIVFDNDDII